MGSNHRKDRRHHRSKSRPRFGASNLSSGRPDRRVRFERDARLLRHLSRPARVLHGRRRQPGAQDSKGDRRHGRRDPGHGRETHPRRRRLDAHSQDDRHHLRHLPLERRLVRVRPDSVPGRKAHLDQRRSDLDCARRDVSRGSMERASDANPSRRHFRGDRRVDSGRGRGRDRQDRPFHAPAA
jgi:hypothetical protein